VRARPSACPSIPHAAFKRTEVRAPSGRSCRVHGPDAHAQERKKALYEPARPCPAIELWSPWKSGAEAHALQTLARGPLTRHRAKRLECVRFIGAFGPLPDCHRFWFPRHASKRTALSINLGRVGQTFLSAGLRDFPVVRARSTRQECLVNPQMNSDARIRSQHTVLLLQLEFHAVLVFETFNERPADGR